MHLKSRRNKILLVSVVLLLALTVYFYKVVFLGRVLSATDGLFTYPPYTSVTPLGWQRASNALLGDQTIMFYPFLNYARESVRHGYLPLWNPYIEMGTPFLADAQSAVFYPINILFYILPFKDAFNMSAFFRLFIAGFGMYLFVSALGLDLIASLFSSLVFMFCAFNIVWLSLQNTNVSIFLPWLFLFIHKFMNTGEKIYFIGLALVTGVQFLGGHPETSAHVLLAAALYLLVHIIWEYRDKRDTAATIKKFANIIIAFILGFMIASPMLLPFLSGLFKSVLWATRSRGSADNLNLPMQAFSTLLMPNFFGSPVLDNYWGIGNFNMIAGYVGIIPLLMAGLAIMIGHKDRYVLFFSFLALGVLFVVYSVPPFSQVFNLLPLYNHMANYGLLLIFQFSMAVLAGIGVEILSKIRPEFQNTVQEKTEQRNRIYLPSSVIENPGSNYIKKKVYVAVGTIVLLGFACLLLTLVFNKAGSSSHFESIADNFYSFLIKVGLFFLWLALYQSIQHKRSALMILVTCIVFFDLFSFGQNYNPQVPKTWIYPQTPEPISYMQKDKSLYRFVSLGATYIPNSLMVYHLYDVRGYDWPGNKRYDTFFRTFLDKKPYFGIYFIRLMDFYDKSHPHLFVIPEKILKIFQLINVKYVGGINKLYSLSNFRKRAFLVHNIIFAATPDNALHIVADRIDDLLKDSAVIEGNNIELAPCKNRNADHLIIDSYQPDSVKLTTFNQCKDVLVLSDTYDSGWEVRVDGKRQPILHADYLFRGVLLEPGQHHVVFAYKPFSFTLGLILSAAGVLTVIGFVFL